MCSSSSAFPVGLELEYEVILEFSVSCQYIAWIKKENMTVNAEISYFLTIISVYVKGEKNFNFGGIWCLDKLNAKFCFMIYLVMFVADCFHSACWSTYVCGWCEHQAIIGIYPNQCNTVNTLVQHCNWRRAHQFNIHSQVRGWENYFFFV